MEFITFIERNHKEDETFIFYLQWTGNEKILTWLSDTTKHAVTRMNGDCSHYDIDIHHKLTEDAVDQHCKLSYGDYTAMFQKVVGVCTMWDETPWDVVNNMDPWEVATWMDRHFFGARIRNCFVS